MLRLISRFIQGILSRPVFVVCQDFVINNDGYWELSFYRTRRGAIKQLKMAQAEGQQCDNDVVIKLDSFSDITDLVNDQSTSHSDDFLDGRVIVANSTIWITAIIQKIMS